MPERRQDGGDKTGFPPPSSGPTSSDMEKQIAAKIAATTAYLNKEREKDLNKEMERVLNKEKEQADTRKRKELKEEQTKLKEKEKAIEKESAMEDFKRLQARRREAEGKR